MNSDDFSFLTDRIWTPGRVLIAGHVNPDGDCIGSLSALGLLFSSFSWDVLLHNPDEIPYNFRFLEQPGTWLSSPPDREPDLFVIVDCGSPDRVGAPLHAMITERTVPAVLFDHHPVHDSVNENTYDYCWSDSSACATAAMIYRFMTEAGIPLTASIARSLYAAVMSDTGGMRYSSTNSEAFSIMSEFVAYIEPWEIASRMWEDIPVEQLYLLSEVLGEMRILADGRAAAMVVRQEQFERYGLTPAHTDKFVNYARSVRGVELALRFREIGADTYKVSMRSRGAVDASIIAHELGGGGHRNAAGFVFRGSYEDGIELIGDIIRNNLDET